MIIIKGFRTIVIVFIVVSADMSSDLLQVFVNSETYTELRNLLNLRGSPVLIPLTIIRQQYGGARGVVVIVVGNGHGDTSSNPEPD